MKPSSIGLTKSSPQKAVVPKTEVPVGFEKDTNKLVTLKDLFETAKVKSEASGVLFTPLITKQLKRKYDGAYASYKEGRADLSEVEPEYVKELLKKNCSEYFDKLRYHIDECRQ